MMNEVDCEIQNLQLKIIKIQPWEQVKVKPI